jgi:hypothetical protein
LDLHFTLGGISYLICGRNSIFSSLLVPRLPSSSKEVFTGLGHISPARGWLSCTSFSPRHTGDSRAFNLLHIGCAINFHVESVAFRLATLDWNRVDGSVSCQVFGPHGLSEVDRRLYSLARRPICLVQGLLAYVLIASMHFTSAAGQLSKRSSARPRPGRATFRPYTRLPPFA